MRHSSHTINYLPRVDLPPVAVEVEQPRARRERSLLRLRVRAAPLRPAYSGEKVANRSLGFGTRDRKWSLNDGRIPNVRGVRVAPGSGYSRWSHPATREEQLSHRQLSSSGGPTQQRGRSSSVTDSSQAAVVPPHGGGAAAHLHVPARLELEAHVREGPQHRVEDVLVQLIELARVHLRRQRK
jgi:hypothetical protein